MKSRHLIYYLLNLSSNVKSIFYKRWNRLFFWLLGVQYGKNLNVYNRVYLQGDGKVIIGDDFIFLSGDSCNPICRNIRGTIYTMDSEACIKIGNRVGISSACLWAKERITIGNDVNIGGDCLIIDNDAHPINFMQRRMSYITKVGQKSFYNTIVTAPVVIEDDVWIGARCQILKGVHIGARSIIAAGSIVTKDVPPDVIAGGNPCRVIRPLNAET